MLDGNRASIVWRSSSSSTGAVTRITCQSSWRLRTSRQADWCSFVTKNGEKRQISSFGQISRRPPPANPQPDRERQRAELAGEQGGSPTPAPDEGAGVRARR